MTGPGSHPTLTWSAILPESPPSADYMFFIRQVQLPYLIEMDIQVPDHGEQSSALSVDPGGSTFEFWAVLSTSPPSSYLLDTITVGHYLPTVGVTIRTEDPYLPLPRTRADRPILVDVDVQGLLSDPQAPESSKSVTLFRQVQSYGATGTGDPLDRSLATLVSRAEITSNGMITVSIPSSAIPGTTPAKVRGEERFTICSKDDYWAAASILDSGLVQVWPVADAAISGIGQGQVIGASVPQVTFQVNDLYPSSTTWAQIYKGSAQTGVTGTMIPGSSVAIDGSVPVNRTISVANYGPNFDSDGVWTMELLTQTPFGTDRLAQVSFIVQRTGMTLADWRQAHFGSDSDIGDGADGNDYDKDGIVNLIEFAFGLDPKQSSIGQLPVAERIGDQFAIRFTPPEGIAGMLHGAEWSSTLQPDSWLPVTNTGELPEHAFSVPVTGNPRLFLRLKATAQ